MAFNVIETPGIPNGDERQQIEQMYNYLLRLSQDLNINLDMIGSNDLTDEERQVMTQILAAAGAQAGAAAGSAEAGLTEMESLKSLIIKTAKFVQTKLDEYRMNLVRETVAEGQFGKYVRNTKLDLEVTPEGITQEYKFHEAVNGIKDYELNTKAYIKTGQLRTENNVPVYGVAIGKDVVTFNNDGTEVYHGENRVAELTADELTFYRMNGSSNEVLAKYAGNRIGFYYQGNEVFYIAAGKIYCAKDLEITSGGKLIINSGTGMEVKSGGNVEIKSGGAFKVDVANFVIDSANKILKTGQWNFTDGGITKYRSGTQAYLSFYTDEGTNEVKDFISYFNSPAAGKLFQYHMSDEGFYLKRLQGASLISKNLGTASYPWDSYMDWAQTHILTVASNDYQDQKIELEQTAAYFYVPLYYTSLVQISERAKKHNIKPMPEMGKRLDRLEPVTFVYNDDDQERTRYGLIYEDTVGVMPEICTGEGEAKAINYVELVPMLLKEIQDLRARVRALEEIQEG